MRRHDDGHDGVTAAFQDFRGNLAITGLQESVIAARQEKVRAVVAGGLAVEDSFLTGSYGRCTLIGRCGTRTSTSTSGGAGPWLPAPQPEGGA